MINELIQTKLGIKIYCIPRLESCIIRYSNHTSLGRAKLSNPKSATIVDTKHEKRKNISKKGIKSASKHKFWHILSFEILRMYVLRYAALSSRPPSYRWRIWTVLLNKKQMNSTFNIEWKFDKPEPEFDVWWRMMPAWVSADNMMQTPPCKILTWLKQLKPL